MKDNYSHIQSLSKTDQNCLLQETSIMKQSLAFMKECQNACHWAHIQGYVHPSVAQVHEHCPQTQQRHQWKIIN